MNQVESMNSVERSPAGFWMGIAALCAIVTLAGVILHRDPLWQPGAVALGVSLAMWFGAIPSFRGYRFTMWVIAAVIAAMVYPSAFRHWGPVNL